MSKLRGLILFTLLTQSLLACPEHGNFLDSNCDGVVKIVVTGDSIVYGIGDSKKGGYVSRLQNHNPEIQVINLGFPGITTDRLVRRWKQAYTRKKGRIFSESLSADIVVIDVGRNDFWQFIDISQSTSNIKQLIGYIKSRLSSYRVPPYIVMSKMLPTNRAYQKGYIEELNTGLELIATRTNYRTLIPFDDVNPELISWDGLHPGKEGYDQMYKIIEAYLRNQVRPDILKNRPDIDKDSVYDLFETRKFLTNPTLADSDFDTFSDSEEIFQILSNPLDPLSPQITPSPSPSPSPSESATPEESPSPEESPTP